MQKHGFVAWLLVAVVSWAHVPAWADTQTADAAALADGERAIALPALIDEALRNSPGLAAKKRAYESARAKIIPAWLPDDPTVGVDVQGQHRLLQLSPRMDNEYMAMQTIPFPTKLLLRWRLALREADMAYQRYQEEQRQIIWHIEQPYYELLLARKTLAALDETQRLAQKLVAAARARYESNQGSQQDLLKAQIELAKINNDLFNWQQKAHLAEAHFSHILNQPLATRYRIDEPAAHARLTSTTEELEQRAIAARPELQALAAAVRRAKTSRTMAFTNWLPDITGRIAARQFSGEDSIRETDTFIGITVPVWSLLKGVSGDWKSAARDVQEAAALYTEMQNEVWLAIHEAYAKVQVSAYALRNYDTAILPQAKQQVEVAFAAYQAGRADFLSLIDAQRTLKETQIAYYQVAAEYAMGWSNLRLAVGAPLPEETP